MNNVKELRSELIKVFKEVRGKRIKPQEAKTLVQTAGAIIKSAKTELDHSKYIGSKKPIEFLSNK